MANAAWVIFGMVEILTELANRGTRGGVDPLAALEVETGRLKSLLDTLFDADPETVTERQLYDLFRAIEPVVTAIEARATQLVRPAARDAIVKRSLTAVLGAVADIRRLVREFEGANPEIGLSPTR